MATLTVVVGRHYERKKELDALYRDKKTAIYDEFLKEFFSVFFSGGKDVTSEGERDLVPFLQEFTQKLVRASSPGSFSRKVFCSSPWQRRIRMSRLQKSPPSRMRSRPSVIAERTNPSIERRG